MSSDSLLPPPDDAVTECSTAEVGFSAAHEQAPTISSRALLDLRITDSGLLGEIEPFMREKPGFHFATTLERKGPIGVGDADWHRLIFRASQRDPETDVRVTTYGELAYQLPYSFIDRESGVESPLALKLGFKREHGDWEYGWGYNALERRFERFAGSDLKKDEAGNELWGARKLGPLKLRGFLSQKWNNLGEDPQKDRTTTIAGGTALELALPASTWLTVSHSRGTAESSRDFLSPARRRRLAEVSRTTERSVETTTASLYHWSEKWDVSLSTSYAPSRDPDSPDAGVVNVSHDLSGSFNPNDKLWITPSVGFWESREQSAGGQSQGATASLSVFYGPFLEHYTLTLWGSYDWGSSSDGYWDAQTINASALLSRRLGRTLLGDAWLSFEVGSNLYRDAVYSSSSYSEMYGRLLLRLLAF